MIIRLGSAMLAFVAICVTISTMINVEVPDAYMDEIFHVPQTQRYCQGEWNSWNPKITTFPGLYLIAATPATLFRWISLFLFNGYPHIILNILCSTASLRTINVLLSLACIPVFYALAKATLPERSHAQLLLMTAVCALFPLHFFYTFLYYTDVASTLFLLSAWVTAEQQGGIYKAALWGAGAVLMRQTNAVWMAFITARMALEMCMVETAPTGVARKDVSASTSTIIKTAWASKFEMMKKLWPLISVVALFALFVIHNGGVVVGDKAHHAPVRHYMQPLYCAFYCCILLIGPVVLIDQPWLYSTRRFGELKSKRNRHPKTSFSLVAAMALAILGAIQYGTLAHPFLLADNRHYTFYIWRRLINRTTWSRYALLPAYVWSVLAIDRRLTAAQRHPLERILLALTASVVLVPAHLIEFRYYSPVFYVLFMLMQTPSLRALTALCVIFAVINALTMYIFVERPYTWGDGSVARFLW